MSPPWKGREINCFLPCVRLSVTTSSSTIRQCVMHKNHNSCIYISPLPLFVGLSITKLCPLYNLITVKIFQETSYICKAHSDNVSCIRNKLLHVYFFSKYFPCNITKCNFAIVFIPKRGRQLFFLVEKQF